MNTSDGEIKCRELPHQKDDVRAFYQQFTGEVKVHTFLRRSIGLGNLILLEERVPLTENE